ncbi:MAG: PilN domain-containing protein [Halanaerobiaceae bacterium]
MKVNLIKDKSSAFSVNWIEMAVIGVLGVVLITVAIYFYSMYSYNLSLQNQINNLDTEINELNIKVAEYRKLENMVEELQDVEEKMESLEYIWNTAVIEQGYVVPESTMLTYLEVNSQNEISLNGLADDNKKVLQFMNNLNISPIYKQIKIRRLTQDEDSDFELNAIVIEEGDK